MTGISCRYYYSSDITAEEKEANALLHKSFSVSNSKVLIFPLPIPANFHNGGVIFNDCNISLNMLLNANVSFRREPAQTLPLRRLRTGTRYRELKFQECWTRSAEAAWGTGFYVLHPDWCSSSELGLEIVWSWLPRVWRDVDRLGL